MAYTSSKIKEFVEALLTKYGYYTADTQEADKLSLTAAYKMVSGVQDLGELETIEAMFENATTDEAKEELFLNLVRMLPHGTKGIDYDVDSTPVPVVTSEPSTEPTPEPSTEPTEEPTEEPSGEGCGCGCGSGELVPEIVPGSTLIPSKLGGTYDLYDILWSDGEVTQNVRSKEFGAKPIALCIAATGFFGSSEPARFMALKYAGGSSDGNTTGTAIGSLTSNGNWLRWTQYGSQTDVVDLTNYNSIISGGNSYCFLADYEGSFINQSCGCGCGCGSGEPTMIYNENHGWIGIDPNNILTGYALGDISGKQNTQAVNNSGSLSHYPAFTSVLNYYTDETRPGDWHLPSLGELSVIATNQTNINTKLAAIATEYPQYCMSGIDANNHYWSSTEYGSGNAYNIYFLNGYVYDDVKYYDYLVIPMVQL